MVSEAYVAFEVCIKTLINIFVYEPRFLAYESCRQVLLSV